MKPSIKNIFVLEPFRSRKAHLCQKGIPIGFQMAEKNGKLQTHTHTNTHTHIFVFIYVEIFSIQKQV